MGNWKRGRARCQGVKTSYSLRRRRERHLSLTSQGSHISIRMEQGLFPGWRSTSKKTLGPAWCNSINLFNAASFIFLLSSLVHLTSKGKNGFGAETSWEATSAVT